MLYKYKVLVHYRLCCIVIIDSNVIEHFMSEDMRIWKIQPETSSKELDVPYDTNVICIKLSNILKH